MLRNANSRILASTLQIGWRFDVIAHLGGMTGDDSFPEVLEQALDEELEDVAIALGVPAKRASTIEKDELLELARRKRKYGFLLKVATPVRNYFEGNSCSFSWGHYRTTWIYSEDMIESLPTVEAWVEARCAEDRERSTCKTA